MPDEKLIQIADQVKESKKALNSDKIKDNVYNVKIKLKESLGIDLPEDTIVEIAALFALPDNDFDFIGDSFLESFERSLNNTQSKIELCNSLNLANIKSEDIVKSAEDWNIMIDTQFGKILSTPKKEFLKKIFGIIANIVMDSEGINKRVIQIPISIENEAKIPTYANTTDAGADIYANEDITLDPGETKIIHTGIKLQIPNGYEIQIRPRSGLSARSKLRIANAPGTIDSGYRDEIGIICENTEPKIKNIESHYDNNGQLNIDSIEYGSPITIDKGERIAQLVLSEVPIISFIQVERISEIGNRGGGFGSTGE